MLPYVPVRLERTPDGVVLRVTCPCGEELEHRDPFDPIAVCRCGAEIAINIEAAGVVLGRA